MDQSGEDVTGPRVPREIWECDGRRSLGSHSWEKSLQSNMYLCSSAPRLRSLCLPSVPLMEAIPFPCPLKSMERMILSTLFSSRSMRGERGKKSHSVFTFPLFLNDPIFLKIHSTVASLQAHVSFHVISEP